MTIPLPHERQFIIDLILAGLTHSEASERMKAGLLLTSSEVDYMLSRNGISFPKPWPREEISDERKRELQALSLT